MIAHNIKKLFRNKQFVFFLICYTFFLIEWLSFVLFYCNIGNNLLVTIAKGVGDSALILAIYWLIPVRAKWIILIPIWTISVLFLLNGWYSQFWGDYITPVFYRLMGNVNFDLINSVMALVSLRDLIFLLFPLSLSFIYFRYFKQRLKASSAYSNKIKLYAVTLSVLAFLVSQCAFITTNIRWNKDGGMGPTSFRSVISQRLSEDMYVNRYTFSKEGLSVSLLKSIIAICLDLTTPSGINLNDNEIMDIDNYINDVPSLPEIIEFKANEEKNVIIIVVESLNAEVIGKVINGHAVTPVMNNLIKSDGTIHSLNILPQIKDGLSNDGQLLTNTGLLPLNKGVSSYLFGDKIIYPHISEILKIDDSIAVFADNGCTWNQNIAYGNYGFKKIYTIVDYIEDAEKKGRDGAMFAFTSKIIDKCPKPFLLELVTYSSHAPFTEKNVPLKKWLVESDLNEVEKNYLNMINYFDTNLGIFIQQLNSKRLLKNSVIFIVSDHSMQLIRNTKESRFETNNRESLLPIAFIAVNTNLSKKIDISAGQVNIFPTILNIMNKGKNGYHGLDRSMLDSNLSSAISAKGKTFGNAPSVEIARQRRAYTISDTIQRGNYFKKTCKL